jgi:branched-chain amino acid transport system substrate-binding protein
MTSRGIRWAAVLTAGLAFNALVACGGDDGDGAATTSSAAGGSTSTAAAAAQNSAKAADPAAARPASMADWEALWATQRAAIVQRVKDNGWGVSGDGKSLTGPDGFSVDLAKCPSGWSQTEGLSDTSIKVGEALGLSGIYGSPTTAQAIGTMLDHYGTAGSFKDSTGKTRTVNYITKDDGVDPARTPPLIDELIDSDKVFAAITSASANTFKVYDKLNQRCIPHPVFGSGHPAWGDPVKHPWTYGNLLAYGTEAILWGAFVDRHLGEFPAGKVTIAALSLNNDPGNIIMASFKSYLEQSPNADRYDFQSEKVELAAPNLTDPMTTLASTNPQFFFSFVGGAQCPTMMNEAAQNGIASSAKYLFLAGVCLIAGATKKETVGGDGSTANGWWVVNGAGVDIRDQGQQNDAFVKFARAELEARNYDPDAPGDYNGGLRDGWMLAQVLQLAGELPGGLTRANYMLAVRSMDMTNPMLLQGMKFNMSGNKDAYLYESALFQQWSSADQVWKNQGDPLDLSGKSKNCAWNTSTQACG